MSFKKRQELRMHTVTHTGEMPNKVPKIPQQCIQLGQKRDLVFVDLPINSPVCVK